MIFEWNNKKSTPSMVFKLKIRNKFAVFQLDSGQTGLCKIIDTRLLIVNQV